MGEYHNSRGIWSNRAIVPLYDYDHRSIIGISGRTTNDNPVKWTHSIGYPSCSVLYNFWFSREYIKKTKEVILCEGPGDVWKLEMYGIHNVCGLNGGNFSTAKQLTLDSIGVSKIILMMDGDEPGREHSRKIINDCSRFYNIVNITLPEGKDVADLNKNEITGLLNI